MGTEEEVKTSLPMRETAFIKQQINHLYSAENVGYVPINDTSLYETGLRGRKGRLFYAFIIFLFLVALANLSVTVVLLSVLRIGYKMESLEFMRPGLFLRFLHNSDLGSVLAYSGIIGGFAEQELSVTGDEQSVIFQTSHMSSHKQQMVSSDASLLVSQDGIVLSNVEEFRVLSPSSGRPVFSTQYEGFRLPPGIQNLTMKETHVSRITSGLGDPLLVSSPYQVLLKGNEGLVMRGQEVVWLAGADIYLKSVNQSLILDGENGVVVARDKLPLAAEPRVSAPRRYKLCVCMPNGRVFRVPVRSQGYGCNDVRFPESINPCI